jgi:hypothetical protein
MPLSQFPPTAPTGPSLSDPPITGIPPPESSFIPQSPLSMREAYLYYCGLPSDPVLVARTGTTPWIDPTGPEAYLPSKELHPVGKHAINVVWEDSLALRLHTLLDLMEVKWTSTDIVRIGVPKDIFPVILWIGVVTILPCPSRKQKDADKINALKRHTHDFMGQSRSSDDDVQTSYLESADSYKYDTLAIARLIMR